MDCWFFVLKERFGAFFMPVGHYLRRYLALLYDLRVGLYDLRMLFHKKAVILCVHLDKNTKLRLAAKQRLCLKQSNIILTL